MFDRHVNTQLASYLDGELPAPERQRIERHLSSCETCRIECDQVRTGLSMVHALPLASAPAAIWNAIEAATHQTHSQPAWFRYRIPALAAVLTVAIAAILYLTLGHRHQSNWDVVGLQGSTAVDSKPIRGTSTVKPGEWIETASSSSARVQIGAIGVVEVGPATRLRVTAIRPSEHRLALARGEIHAKIIAPPKLFFVDTPSATAEDLGCEYSLKTDEDGLGLLHVTLGWVSFQWKGLESLVPAGASCRTRPHTGPGVPYFDDAPEELIQALGTLAATNYAGSSLDVVLRDARVRDTLTLWHLLPRTESPDRQRIYERIAALSPVPTDVSRERALQLDPDTLARWREALAWTW